MILNEFKAWFAGITATMGATPTIEQWELIKKEIANIGADKAAPAKQGPFVAQESNKDVGKAPRDSLTEAIEAIRRKEEEDRKRSIGIPGFPKDWPSKQYDPIHPQILLIPLSLGIN